MIPNPLARQRRLGQAILGRREQRGLSQPRLAAESGVSASVISRIERPLSDLARRPDPRFVRQLLDSLEFEAAEYDQLLDFAGVAAAGGWWTSPAYARMGEGQRDYALVEAGAQVIVEYGGLFLPGLVQTAAYARHRAQAGNASDVKAVVAGRLERQRRAAGITYRLVLEEQAIYRHPAPPEVMREQLDHLAALMERPNVDIRVLSARAQIGDGAPPRAPFAHMTYPDPGDPPIAIVDVGVERSALVTDADEVAGYARLHERLCHAALSDADSASLIRVVADSLAARI